MSSRDRIMGVELTPFRRFVIINDVATAFCVQSLDGGKTKSLVRHSWYVNDDYADIRTPEGNRIELLIANCTDMTDDAIIMFLKIHPRGVNAHRG